MKAQITLESIGHSAYQEMCGMARFIDKAGYRGAGRDVVGYVPSPCHVAEIVGFDRKFGYARRFVKGFTDYSKANSKGSRGVYRTYFIESGNVYEVKEKTSWSKSETYYCYVDHNDGDIYRMSKDDVDNYLKSILHA